MDTTELAAMLDSWKLAMQSARRSPRTIEAYLRSVHLYLAWCESSGNSAGASPLDRQTLQRWVTHQLEEGAEPASARLRQQSVRLYATWLAEEGEIDEYPFHGLKPPKVDAKLVTRLTDDELKLMLKACSGKDLRDRRDEAMLRLLIETGVRAGELVALNTADVDLQRGLLVVRHGKGGKPRYVGFGAQTGAAIDRYIRQRRHHPRADSAALWLAQTVKQGRLTYHGLRGALRKRAALAGVANFHPHRLRHTFASRWLAGNGSEGGLMAVAGWNSRDMIDRYARSTAAERALAEARRLHLGDL